MVRGPAEASAPPQPILAHSRHPSRLGVRFQRQRPLRLHQDGRADPSSTDGDGPGTTINLVNLNITSLQANWPTITALGNDYNAARPKSHHSKIKIATPLTISDPGSSNFQPNQLNSV